ncbi:MULTISPECIES: tyrosine-type recombinase/integrase [Lactobacillus]|uniref:tyrosine-type recombinase/integrase n=1 Tax=Lactobacillus TaxID=1578 RepID=UPI00107EB4D0|nr:MULTISPECIES: site-specific integrase [Lactobacillus]TGA95007.1 site-specific integrase [Lactobacillus johnsonii]
MAQVYKRGKTWTVRFSKRYTIYDPKSQKHVSKLKQKSKGGFRTKAEATQYGIKLESESISGIDVTKNPEFATYFEKWIATFRLPGVRPATERRYQVYIKHVKKYFGIEKIKDIHRIEYQKIITDFGKHHAPESTRKLNATIRACIQYAINDGLLNKDFTANVKVTGNKAKKRDVIYLNAEEIEKTLKECESNLQPKYKSRYIILTAFLTGARIGEITALHWEDIDFQNNIIDINKSLDQATHELGPTKNESSTRKITVNSKLLEYLKQLKENNEEYVFGLKSTHMPPSNNAINDTLRNILLKANINKPAYHVHSIRHTHVGYLIYKGVDIYAISKRLGHANLSITLDTYANLLDEYKDKENKKIVSLLGQLF